MSKHSLLTLSAVSLTALMLSACYMNKPAPRLAPGQYEESVTTKDAYGTKVTKKTSTDVDVDYDGDRRVVKESKTTRNPRGWFNKETVKSKEVYEEDTDYNY